MNWMSDRLARLRGVPRQQGAHSRGPLLPAPRTESTPRPSLPDLLPASVATARVLVAANDDDVRFMLMRRCQMSEHLDVVADTKEPVSSLRAAFRLRPDLIVVQVQSTKESEAELITAFKELSPESKVFAYSTLPGGAAVSAAMSAGADRYALAGAPLTVLMREIEDLVAPDRAAR
jgi:DNA-binding NarL/FixJ family response regulator